MRKNYLFLIFLSFSIAAFSQVGINTTSPNAALDIEASNSTSPSSSDGLLIPRIEAFPSTDPGFDQNGMLVYLISADGTNNPGFYYWEGVSSTWTSIGSGSSSGTAWDIQGNSGTNTTSNFIGTKDNVGLLFRTNNIARLRIGLNGELNTLNTGQSVFLGNQAGQNDDHDGVDNNNVYIGHTAAQNAVGGSGNVALGFQAAQNLTNGNQNVAIGANALQMIGNGTGNIAIGNAAGSFAGFFSAPNAPINNTLWIENSFDTAPLISGDFANDRVGINVELNSATSNLTHTLTVNGNVYASAGYFTTAANAGGLQTYPDYVFESYYNGESEILPSYKFKSLNELEVFIKKYGHLPGVKSYEEVKDADFQIELGVTSITNLEKIEESFLYIIELNKKIEAQEEELKHKDNKIEDLEKRLEKIEALLAK